MQSRFSQFSFSLAIISGIATASCWAEIAEANQGGGPDENFDPIGVYGPEMLFDVFRKGENVGSHRVRFSHANGALNVEAEFRIEIGFLFFTAYRFLYRSEGVWADGQLRRLAVDVDDDGEIFRMLAQRDGDVMNITGPDTPEIPVPAPIYPTNHWHHGVLDEARVLNTLTGKPNNVRIEPQGRETVTTENGPIAATRFRYTGDLQNEVWYDDAGRWVKMRFEGRDGSLIEYKCRRCQGPDPKPASP